MKRFIVFSIFLVVYLISNYTSYAQTYDFEQYYNRTFTNQAIIPSFNSWALYNHNNYLPNFTQNVYNYQNPSSFLRSYDLNINSLSGWLNNPPVPIYTPTSPMVMKAGQSSTFNYWVIDPDADQLYSSSTLGSTGRIIGGSLGWGFSTNFPGQYLTQTVVYDERGGYAVMRAPVFAKPWWSF